ncbi:major facilitator superfamily domain-containing protein [Lanmaoa asiatica]|nr:major facilitator superfamily domain-containing protein [Lanmaoa asiatica]
MSSRQVSTDVAPTVGESYDRSHRDDYHTEDMTEDRAAPMPDEQYAHVGVKKVEAALRIYGRYSRWCLFIGLALASYIYSLDASTTSAYLTFATSSFGEHSLLSSISVAQSLIVAVGKPVIAKVADVSSRGSAYLGVCEYTSCVGYTVIASAPNVGTMAGGIVLYAIGLQILTQIMIADITTLQWRGLVVSLVSAPFLVNAFIGSNISTAVIEHLGWRWGYGMFAILVPVSLSPLIITLLWAEYKTKKLGLIKTIKDDSEDAMDGATSFVTILQHLRRTAAQLDLVGLILLGTAVSLILLPLTLSQTVKGQWKNVSVISMLTVGVVFLFVFVHWDFRVATRPVIAPRFLKNRSVIFAALIGFFDFMSFYLTYTYLYSFVLVVKTWSLINATYFMQTQTIALTLFAIVAGVSMHLMHRFKYVLVFGLVVRLAGVSMMVHSRGANGSDVEIVWTQILQGFGGGLAAVSAQVGAQAAVPHADVAIITALVLLFTEVGGAVGSACAGAIWSNTMPGNLEKYLPWLTDAQRAELYGSITSVTAFPRGDPVREGVIQGGCLFFSRSRTRFEDCLNKLTDPSNLAYDDTMKVMILFAIGLSIPPVLCALGMPDWHLGDQQNAVDSTDLTGRVSTGQEDGGDGIVGEP